ncbi:MAG: polymer-forming cytoskeletal protein [Alphaproteobacteria bacterium]
MSRSDSLPPRRPSLGLPTTYGMPPRVIAPYGRNEEESAGQANSRTLVVGRDIHVAAEIDHCDTLVVEGFVETRLSGCRHMDVHPDGAFSGMADLDSADIAGAFDGSLTVRDRLILRRSARLTGTIRYGRIEIENGADIEGEIAPLRPAGDARPAGRPPAGSPGHPPALSATPPPVRPRD